MLRKQICLFSLINLINIGFPILCFGSDDHNQNESMEVKLTTQSIQQNGIRIKKVEPKNIKQHLEVVGEITTNRDAMAYIYPRYPGIVKSLKKDLGDAVKPEDVLGSIESNESLQAYDVRSPIAGTVVKKNAIQGELVKEDKPIYEVANLDTVWIDLSIYCKDAACIKVGQPVIIMGQDSKFRAEGIISYVSPIGIEDNQTMLARVVLPNTERNWVPGMYVDASIIIQQKAASMTVNRSAIQTIKNKTVVFTQVGSGFKATPVQLGIADKENVEILSGLSVGQNYVSENSFVLKAEIGKSEIDAD